MTLKDIGEATKIADDFPKGRVIKSSNYKTSFLYGVKAVCIAEEIYMHTLVYRDYLRPLLLQNEDSDLQDYKRYFFLALILTTFCFSSFDPTFGEVFTEPYLLIFGNAYPRFGDVCTMFKIF